MADSIPDQLQIPWSLCPAELKDHNPSYVVFEKENGGFWDATVNQPALPTITKSSKRGWEVGWGEKSKKSSFTTK